MKEVDNGKKKINKCLISSSCRLAVALEEGDQAVARAEEENQNLKSQLREMQCSASDHDIAMRNLEEGRDKLQVPSPLLRMSFALTFYLLLPFSTT